MAVKKFKYLAFLSTPNELNVCTSTGLFACTVEFA